MKCKKCGSEEFEVKVVDIKNEQTNCGLVNFLYGASWLVAVISGIIFLMVMNSTSTVNFWEVIAGVIVDSIELIILWKVFSTSVVSIIVCTLYIKLLPYKVIPVKRAVCKNCGAVQDENE